MAQKLEKLLIWHKANELWDAVNAMLDRPGFRRDWNLHDQIADAIDSVVANIPEGFEQPTDRAFARYLYTSKGSAAEAAARVFLAFNRNYVERQHVEQASALAEELNRMLDSFIEYLIQSNRKDRAVRRADVRVRKRGHRRPEQEETAAIEASARLTPSAVSNPTDPRAKRASRLLRPHPPRTPIA